MTHISSSGALQRLTQQEPGGFPAEGGAESRARSRRDVGGGPLRAQVPRPGLTLPGGTRVRRRVRCRRFPQQPWRIPASPSLSSWWACSGASSASWCPGSSLRVPTGGKCARPAWGGKRGENPPGRAGTLPGWSRPAVRPRPPTPRQPPDFLVAAAAVSPSPNWGGWPPADPP